MAEFYSLICSKLEMPFFFNYLLFFFVLQLILVLYNIFKETIILPRKLGIFLSDVKNLIKS